MLLFPPKEECLMALMIGKCAQTNQVPVSINKFSV